MFYSDRTCPGVAPPPLRRRPRGTSAPPPRSKLWSSGGRALFPPPVQSHIINLHNMLRSRTGHSITNHAQTHSHTHCANTWHARVLYYYSYDVMPCYGSVCADTCHVMHARALSKQSTIDFRGCRAHPARQTSEPFRACSMRVARLQHTPVPCCYSDLMRENISGSLDNIMANHTFAWSFLDRRVALKPGATDRERHTRGIPALNACCRRCDSTILGDAADSATTMRSIAEPQASAWHTHDLYQCAGSLSR